MAEKCTPEFKAKCDKKHGANAYTYYNETKQMCMCGRKVGTKGKERIIGPGGIRVGQPKKTK